jgi:hypothetical protein
MKAYIARTNGLILDLVIRASSPDSAISMLKDQWVDVVVSEQTARATQAMGVPHAEGVHAGVVTRWIAKADWFGSVS